MKYLLLLLLSFPAYSQDFEVKHNPDGSMTVTISKKAVERCDKEGGCAVVSVEFIKDTALQYALKMCGKEI